MSDENRHTLRCQILRYTPNLIRDEWVNIGVVLEELPAEFQEARPRRAADRRTVGNLARPASAPARRRGTSAGAAGGARRPATGSRSRARLNDVFWRHRILGRLERNVRVEDFTQTGDPLRLDYAYRCNGTRGFLHAVALGRDPAQEKVLAYTVECIRARAAQTEFTAITEIEPAPGNPRHQFMSRLFEDQRIAIVPLQHIEEFADTLRPRLQ